MRVIVVGAGTAGLVAARDLRGRGFDVVALEKNPEPGGRISGAERDGFILDLAAQFFTRYYSTTFDVCREAGLSDELVDYRLRAAAWRDGRMYPLELSRDLRASMRSRLYQPGGWRVRMKLARLMAYLLARRNTLAFADPESLGALDRVTLSEFSHRYLNDDVLEYFLQPAASCLSCAQPEDMCAAEGLSLTLHILSGVLKGFVAMDRGMGSIVRALADDRDGAVKCQTPARRIVIENGAVLGVETDQGFMDADAVVCATTATTALELLPGLPDSMRLPLEKVRYSACCHVMYALDRKIAPERTYAVSIPRKTRSPIVSIGLDSAKSPNYAPPGCELAHVFTFGSGAYELNEMSDGEVTTRINREMRKYFDGFTDPLFTEIYRWNEALCFYPPGMATAIGRMRKESYGDVKGLYLCGEYMRIPGTVEGAFRSGLDAAACLAADHSSSCSRSLWASSR